jgi:hypothetical protein
VHRGGVSDVMHTCIAAAYPDAVVSDVRYHSAMM